MASRRSPTAPAGAYTHLPQSPWQKEAPLPWNHGYSQLGRVAARANPDPARGPCRANRQRVCIKTPGHV